MEAEHGKPCILDRAATAAALRLAGKRDEVHPNDAVACAYRDRTAAEAWRASGAENGQPTLGITELDGQVVALIDLRPQWAADCRVPVPPSLADDWKGFGRKLGQRFRWVTDEDGCRVPECEDCGAQVADGIMWHARSCAEVGLM